MMMMTGEERWCTVQHWSLLAAPSSVLGHWLRIRLDSGPHTEQRKVERRICESTCTFHKVQRRTCRLQSLQKRLQGKVSKVPKHSAALLLNMMRCFGDVFEKPLTRKVKWKKFLQARSSVNLPYLGTKRQLSSSSSFWCLEEETSPVLCIQLCIFKITMIFQHGFQCARNIALCGYP